MPLNIRNEAVNQLAEKLAVRQHLTKTEAVKLVVENEISRIDAAVPPRQRLWSCRTGCWPGRRPALKADKAFYDELGGTP
jgi:antitoxin VapB